MTSAETEETEPQQRFHRIAIVNRGEPAMRLINAVREYREEHHISLTTIALYTEPDRHATFVSEADEDYALGPAHVVDEQGRRLVTYVHHPTVFAALEATGADAVWTGWGFVAEDADFAEACERRRITPIGPGSKIMRALGDKIASKRLAEQSGVPVAPWSDGPCDTIEGALAAAEQIGYPTLLKATAGGGGRGIRRVTSSNELRSVFDAARREAESAFGDPTVFLESLIPAARHIEVQIVGDRTGAVWSVGVRDCSVQRRNQKVIEEAPSPALTAAEHHEVREAAARLGRAAGYENVGTVEFLYSSGRFAFMEVNTRLQVEHTITEVTTGLDVVKLQLALALGEVLEGEPPATTGHAIEVRLTAEDADAGFLPAPGRVEILSFPHGPGLRIDSGIEEGDEVVADYDSMVAKVVGYGATRREAIARLRRALSQTTTVIRGGNTNKGFLQALLEHPDFVDARIDTEWIDRLLADGTRLKRPNEDIALVAGAISAYLSEMDAEILHFQTSAGRGRPEVGPRRIGRAIALRYGGESYDFEVAHVAHHGYVVSTQGQTMRVHSIEIGSGRRLTISGRSHRTVSYVYGARLHVQVDGAVHHIVFDEGGVVRSPAPAVVVTIDIHPGDEVEAGDRLAVIEAMKMETAITAEFAGSVREVLVHPNVQVAAGSPMIVVDLRDTIDETPRIGRVDFADLDTGSPPEHRRCIHRLEELRNALLGYDIELGSLVEAMRAVRACSDEVDEEARRRLTDEILTLFVDLIAIFRRQPPGAEENPSRRGPEDYLMEYLRTVELKGKSQPESLVQMLDSVLAHYRVSTEEPGPELWSALYRLMQVESRIDELVPAIAALLEDRALRPGDTSGSLRRLIDRLIRESRNRYPAIHDLATDVRYRLFEAPFLADVRQTAYEDAERSLATLRSSDSTEEEVRLAIEALVECPQPLAPALTRQLESESPDAAALLEVMIRRYYRLRRLEDLRTHQDRNGPVLEAAYEHDGTRIRLVATATRWEHLRDRLTALRPRLEAGEAAELVLDVFLVGMIEGSDADTSAQLVADILDDTVGDLGLRRIVVASTLSQTATGIGSVFHFTFRPRPEGGYSEERRYRDLHPMMGKRLQLSRLDNFTTSRLPTLEDIYLFHCVAKDNPADERLFAMAEVRDLTKRVDPTEGTVRYPELERVFNEVVASMRRVQAHRPPNKRLVWNRIVLYVWPVLEMSPDEIRGVVQQLAPAARGIGLEKTVMLVRTSDGSGGSTPHVIEVTDPTGSNLMLVEQRTSVLPIRTLTKHEQRRIRLRQRGLLDPFDVILFLTTGGSGVPAGTFQEYDLEDERLVPVDREPGSNQANIVVGVLTTPTDRYPEGMRRVILVGDPGRGMGNVAEPECRRINAALDLAEELGVPLDWFAVSSGARISMESGTENMDWVARVLRRLIEFTQAGHEVNVVVTGVNVGAQPYWNAEATMLMHTRGILVMTTNASMVLTGKEALDFSGGVSAEDNLGIGGYSRVMGPNGQAQYFAADVREACQILFDHHRFAYIAPGENVARRARTSDPYDRDVGRAPHGGLFETVADVFSLERNPDRKQPFEIRKIMAAAVDADLPTLERWYGMQDAEVAVVWDAFLGGFPVTLLGLESKPIARTGFIPADGPESWTAGTLFPRASKKVARAINSASGNRPVVVLANLSGFDGSPESMRRLQLEYGAEIGRAVVNFVGPVVFCVISRYHGGAFVVFSAALNDRLEVAAVEGARASVIGGAPAAAVVFSREVDRLTEADPRVEAARRLAAAAPMGERSFLLAELDRVRADVHADHMRAKAVEFEGIHDIERAKAMGSVHRIISAPSLRPYLIDAVERGLAAGPDD